MRRTLGFSIAQHSLFLGAIGQAFFYLHLFKPHFHAWAAGPLFMIPWAIVFVLFYHNRPIFPPRTIRRWWLSAAYGYALVTVIAELIWLHGYVPPMPPAHPVLSIIIIQGLMGIGFLSFIPIIRDYLRNPHLWQ